YHGVTITGLDAPLARRYGLTRLPQFRFYSRSGVLVTTLTERFTPDDIAAAIDAARKGSKTEARP
ncbi:MAG: hypothetical protein GX595_04660, partial [Lentisphaerae bacterium]|nr:hypothetical protein [Lentisphaerota bacterium]